MKKIITVFLGIVLMMAITCFTACEGSSIFDGENHTFGEWYVSVEPTCLEKGEERRDCETCKHYETKEIEALGHDIVFVEAKDPNHLENGCNEHEKCTRCEYTTCVETPSIAHEFTETTVEPTCTEEGYIEYKCECGYSYKDNIVEKIEHNFSEFETVLEPTCTEEGKKQKHCLDCEEIVEEIIEIKGHSFNKNIIDATCSEEGSIGFVCKCGYSFSVNIPKLEHTESDYIDGENGEKHKECTVCHEILEVLIPEEENEEI